MGGVTTKPSKTLKDKIGAKELASSSVFRPFVSEGDRKLIWAILLAGVFTLLYWVQGTIGPFVMGICLAYLFQPLVTWIAHKGISRSLASLMVVILTVIIFCLFWFIFLPFLGIQIQQLMTKFPSYLDSFFGKVRPWLVEIMRQFHSLPVLRKSETLLSGATQKMFVWATQQVWALVPHPDGLVRFLFYLGVAPFVMFYGLNEWPEWMQNLKELIPHKARPRWQGFFTGLDESISGYIRGQLLVCLSMAGYLSLSFALMGLKNGVMLGVLTGLFVFIPYVGMTIGTLTAFLLTAVHSPTLLSFVLLALILFGGQMLEAFVFIPFFIGRRVGMHPVWLLFAIFTAGALLGFWGVILALPLATFVQSLLKEMMTYYRKSDFFLKKTGTVRA